jgi:TetR/AcrR family transcriptional regulator, transcriptional repressor for nem operon
VEAARQLFFAQGYTATGIAQILAQSSANSGSLYHFFPTKEDLLIAALEKYKAMLEPMVIGPANARASDPIDRLFAVLDGYRQLMTATDFMLGCPIGNLSLEMCNSHPQVRRLVVENFDGWRAAIKTMIEAAQGRLPENVDVEALSHFVLATMEGSVMLARAYRSFTPFDAAIAGLRDHFDRLVKDGSDWSAPKPLPT